MVFLEIFRFPVGSRGFVFYDRASEEVRGIRIEAPDLLRVFDDRHPRSSRALKGDEAITAALQAR
jgi:hypothetical protein